MSNSITDDSLKGIVNPKIKSLTSFTLSEDTEDMLKNVNNHTVCCQHSTVWLTIFFKKIFFCVQTKKVIQVWFRTTLGLEDDQIFILWVKYPFNMLENIQFNVCELCLVPFYL